MHKFIENLIAEFFGSALSVPIGVFITASFVAWWALRTGWAQARIGRVFVADDVWPLSLTVALLCGYVMSAAAWYVQPLLERPTAKEEKPSIPTPLVRYSLGTLPVVVTQHSTAWIVPLNPSAWGIQEVSNREPVPFKWPRDFRTKGAPIDPIWVAELTNYSERALLAFTIKVQTRFYELKFLPTKLPRHQGDKTQFDISLPGAGEGTYGYIHKGTQIQISHGDLFRAVHRDITVPVIPARGVPVKLYFVNQSRWIVGFDMPNSARAIVDGQPAEIAVRLVRPRTTVIDSIPLALLGPATQKWKGVPDGFWDVDAAFKELRPRK